MVSKGFVTPRFSSGYVSHFDGANKQLKGFFDFTGAEILALPKPSEYNSAKYASLIDSPYPTVADLQEAIDKTDWFIREFQRQTQFHIDNGNTPNAVTTKSWTDTAQKTNTALREKLASVNATAGSATANAGTGATSTPTAGNGVGKIALMIGIPVVLAITAYFVFRKKKVATA